MPQVHRTKKGFKVACWILAVICGVFIFLLPFSAMLLWLAYKANVEVKDYGVKIVWFGTREVNWEDFHAFKWAPPMGITGALMRPLTYTLENGKRGNIAVGVFEDNDKLLDVLRTKTELHIS